jgi:hypothetical protein
LVAHPPILGEIGHRRPGEGGERSLPGDQNDASDERIASVFPGLTRGEQVRRRLVSG